MWRLRRRTVGARSKPECIPSGTRSSGQSACEATSERPSSVPGCGPGGEPRSRVSACVLPNGENTYEARSAAFWAPRALRAAARTRPRLVRRQFRSLEAHSPRLQSSSFRDRQERAARRRHGHGEEAAHYVPNWVRNPSVRPAPLPEHPHFISRAQWCPRIKLITMGCER